MAKPQDESFAVSEDEVQGHVASAHLGLLAVVLRNRGVKKAIGQALAAGVPWAQILAIILPIIMSIFSGGTIDWAAIIAAILALIPKPTP